MLSLTSPATSINTLGANRAAHRQKGELERGAEKSTNNMFQLPFPVVAPGTCFIWCHFGWRFVDFGFPVGEKESKTVSKYAFLQCKSVGRDLADH